MLANNLSYPQKKGKTQDLTPFFLLMLMWHSGFEADFHL
jgi:hypothetical protein